MRRKGESGFCTGERLESVPATALTGKADWRFLHPARVPFPLVHESLSVILV